MLKKIVLAIEHPSYRMIAGMFVLFSEMIKKCYYLPRLRAYSSKAPAKVPMSRGVAISPTVIHMDPPSTWLSSCSDKLLKRVSSSFMLAPF